MTPLDLILASTSIHRQMLLKRLGVPFRCISPRVDEDAFKDLGLSPILLAERLARLKSQDVGAEWRDATVVGGDQLVSFEGRIFGKPGNAEAAVEQLLAMAGRSHKLVTAMVICHRGRTIAHTDVTTLQMRPLSRVEVERYVAADSPLDCAGAYKLESRGISLFDRIDSRDHTAVTGLPLMALTTILRGLGFSIP